VQPPDLLIYLNASAPTLVGTYRKEEGSMKKNIRLDYLKKIE
jgi:hypothetical protein